MVDVTALILGVAAGALLIYAAMRAACAYGHAMEYRKEKKRCAALREEKLWKHHS